MARYDAGYRPRSDYDYRGSWRGNRSRPYRSGWGARGGPAAGHGRESTDRGGYAREFRRNRFHGRNRGGIYSDYAHDYDRDRGYSAYGRDFNRRESRWETDRGDPFHDRERHTPVRMMRGGWRKRGGYDRDFDRNRAYGRGYDREFRPSRRRY